MPEKRLDIREAWSRLLEYVRDEKQYLNFVLKPSEAAFDGDTVLISYPGGVDHAYYGRILDSKNLAFLEGKMAEFTGKAVKVRVGFGDAPAGDARTGAVTAGPAANNPEDDGAIPPPESQMMKNPEIIEYESKNPTVEKIKNIFQGQIIKKGEGDA